MSFARLWAFLAIGLPVLAAVIAPFPSVDLTYHLRAGGEILDTGRIPNVDTWTFTVAGQPWLDQQWLPQLVMAAVYRVAGWTGLVFLRAALVGVAFGLLFDLCRRRAGSIRIAAWLTLAAFVAAAVTLGLRPQLFGVALFAAVLWLIVRRDELKQLLWLVPIVVGAWANVHGSFILGLVLVGIAFVEDLLSRTATVRRTALVLAGSLLATLVNPFAGDVWSYAARISTNSVITRRITEWQPTSPLMAEGALFYASVVATLALLVVSGRGGRLSWRPILWLIPFAVLGAWAVRGLAWWPFVAAATLAPLLPGSVAAAGDASRSDPPVVRRLNLVIVALLAGVALVALPMWRPIDPGLGTPVLLIGAAPAGITGALRQIVKPGDRILAPQVWGSWFEFAFPQATVAVDSRIELFPDDVWDDVDVIEAGAVGWEELADRWGVTTVVAGPARVNFAAGLRSGGWQEVFSDADGAVFRRSTSAFDNGTGVPVGRTARGV